jgi:hypothetical protein
MIMQTIRAGISAENPSKKECQDVAHRLRSEYDEFLGNLTLKSSNSECIKLVETILFILLVCFYDTASSFLARAQSRSPRLCMGGECVAD